MQEIFKINLKRLDEIEIRRSQSTNNPPMFIFRDDILNYAKVHFDRFGNSGMGSWNGRQIRNAFQVASAMARYEGIENPGAQVQLRMSHFEKVAVATRQYDEFRKSTLGNTDAEKAKKTNQRDDAYVFSPERTPGDHGGYQQQYGGASPGYPNNTQGQRTNVTHNSPSYTTARPLQSGYPGHSQQWPRPPAATGSPAPRTGPPQGGYGSQTMNSIPTNMPQSMPDKSQSSFPRSAQPPPWSGPYPGGEPPMMQMNQEQMGQGQMDQGQMGHIDQSGYYTGQGPPMH